MQNNFEPRLDQSRDERVAAVKHLLHPPTVQNLPQTPFMPPNQLVPYAAPPAQLPYQSAYPYYPQHNPYFHPPPGMALVPYNPAANAAQPPVPAMHAERSVTPYSAYRVRKKEAVLRVNDSDKAFGPLLDQMKLALKNKKHS
ncbi:hypothetical protein BWQ96_04506 [Gracilariopsis chorda]|uniref:Uncharacterized protein n=1 Tax=Gracilariopsis chorda TaxID=448386 RepID=A0A2V3IUB8_9FLOR|nr:hypothetical protein BWQ96_04506 [Gracilariopsis chorda]|eukprot:PXF45738.1 hypothetical protein BWQ96_04506 [Gracilariopsis chorda]